MSSNRFNNSTAALIFSSGVAINGYISISSFNIWVYMYGIEISLAHSCCLILHRSAHSSRLPENTVRQAFSQLLSFAMIRFSRLHFKSVMRERKLISSITYWKVDLPSACSTWHVSKSAIPLILCPYTLSLLLVFYSSLISYSLLFIGGFFKRSKDKSIKENNNN